MADTIPTAEAAAIAGVTERRMRQLAELLHAERDELGRLHFDRVVVDEYADRRRAAVRTITNAQRIDALEAEVAELRELIRRHLPSA